MDSNPSTPNDEENRLSSGTAASSSSTVNMIMSSSENTNNENREKELLSLGGENPSERITSGGVQPETASTEDTESDSAAKSKSVETGETSANTENENREKSTKEHDKYAEHVSYNEDGEAIYTDPETKYRYKWSTEKNEWTPVENVERTNDNPYENEHYRWCSETNQWLPKEDASSKTENEFYKWDEEKKQWIPKLQTTDTVYTSEDGLHTYRDKDNVEYFWDTEKNAWFPKIDDDFMARYQMSYGFIDNTSVTSAKPQETVPVAQNVISKVGEEDDDEDKDEKLVAGTKRKAPAEPPKWFDLPPDQNTKVYVNNLPLDITEEEFVEVMSKCGLIMRDPQSQKFKVKLYAEPNGQLKGDGLCDYIKIESVDLALNLLDGYDVRGHTIKVQRAKFQMRGEYNPALKPKKNKKAKEKLLKMKEKLFDWRPEKMRGERSKHERVVVVKNLFTPELFEKEVHLIMDYQNDLREECGKCGTVRRVVLYDRHPEGIAQITMGDPEEADLVVQMMNGRFFGKRKLEAEIWDGKTKFKIGETETETAKRLTNWDKFLETDAGLEAKKRKLETEEKEESHKSPKVIAESKSGDDDDDENTK